MPSRSRTFIVGDVHGCLQELKELLHVAGIRRGCDRIILLGDLVDRGPDSVGVLRYARELNAECVLGNHEEKHLRWRKHERIRLATGKENPMREFPAEKIATQATLTEEDWSFIEGMPYYVDVALGVVAVHGGLEPHRMFLDQRPNTLLRCRWVDKDTNKMVGGRLDPEESSIVQPPNSIFWTERWRGPENVVYGHHVHGKDFPHFDKPAPGVTCMGIDTGCCFGGRLTGLLFEESSKVVDVIHVEAGREYASWKAFNDRARRVEVES